MRKGKEILIIKEVPGVLTVMKKKMMIQDVDKAREYSAHNNEDVKLDMLLLIYM